MAKIKTRDAVKGTIKTIDKAAIAAERMKSAYAKTKEKAEQGYYADESSAIEYASDKMSYAADRIKDESIHQFNKQGQKSVRVTKDNIVKAKDKIADFKTKRAMKAAEQKQAQASIKATQRTAQVAKATAKAAAEATKATVKATIAAVKAIIAGTKALISAIVVGGWIAVVIILIVVLFGCAVSLFGGGGESNAYTPVSAEVEAYEPLIRQYAKQHGIPEYTELIKAVMMQESGGRGSDPMQASECGYNTRYPHTPNGITDPEYSIDVGIQNLAACLRAAEVENLIDMERIKLALQGYNFGNGYISWAKTNYGGYSYTNAVEFSAIQAERLGWDSYGDTQYVSHVLRYYPYGRAFTDGGNQAIVEVALTQVGNVGGEPYWSWYGFDSHVEWCACFVSWCAEQCGYIESSIIPKYALCSDGVNLFQRNGQWQDMDYEPTAGAIIFFDWDGDGIIDHTGIVEKCENSTVYTIEGNSGDACRQRSYPVGSSVIYGYGIEFLGIHPQYRKRGIQKLFLDALIEDYYPEQDICITTYRKGDRADTGYRKELQKLGFAERELLIEFGYPTQRFVLTAKCSETNDKRLSSNKTEI